MSLEIDKNIIERILIIRLSAIGDVIRVLPSLALLRERFPDANISWVVEEKAYDILGGMSGIDEVILFPRKRLTKRIKNLPLAPKPTGARRTPKHDRWFHGPIENTRVRSTSKARVDSETKKTDKKRISNIECRISNVEVRSFVKFNFLKGWR